MAALPAFTFDYVDVVVVVWLIIGIIRGRKRGMTQELLPTMQWVAILFLAGLFYHPLADIIFSNTGGAFNRLWANVTGYLLIAVGIHMAVLWIKQVIGEKLTGSDMFGRWEYYFGMISGLVRFACIVLVLIALMHARIYSAAELAETEKMQKRNFEDIRFPTYGSVQHAVLAESFTGRLVEDNMSKLLISSTTPVSKPTETIAKKREDTINAILGTPKK